MTHIEKVRVFEAMEKFGGGFVSRLGNAGLSADANNMARIVHAFPDYVLTYRAIAEMLQAANAVKERAEQMSRGRGC